MSFNEKTKTILHVDMDAFFASVEALHHPEWHGKPLIVGSGPHERGVVSTCNYEARRFGVHSAMPSRTAYALCPHAVFVHPNMKLYEKTSNRVFEIFSHYTPFVEGVSIDEAFLDISGSLHLYGDSRQLGESLRSEIRRICGITCSVGIAPNRLLAKIGSEQRKPNGLTIMPFDPKAIADFLAPKPIRILWGIGPHTEGVLKPYGITTCGDIQRMELEQLATILRSLDAATTLHNYSLGISSDAVNWQPRDEKSVSREFTFKEDCSDREKVRQTLINLIADVGRRFRTESRWARTARIKLRDSTFDTITRQVQLPWAARDDRTFRDAVMPLFDDCWKTVSCRHSSIRLVGFGIANFQNSPDDAEPSLFADPQSEYREKQEALSNALDALHAKGLY